MLQIVLLICPVIWENLERVLLHVLFLALSTGPAGPIHCQHPVAGSNGMEPGVTSKKWLKGLYEPREDSNKFRNTSWNN